MAGITPRADAVTAPPTAQPVDTRNDLWVSSAAQPLASSSTTARRTMSIYCELPLCAAP